MALDQAIFRRAELLLGDEAMGRIAEKRVIIFGVGGVGSWCAESLVRSGIRKLTIVDSDRVCITHINRQLMATTKTVGQAKVDALKERLLSINPSAEITALQQIFTAETAESFHLESYDYIIDAIDSLKDKALLILMATSLPSKEGDKRRAFFSSMGAALKLDPTRIKIAEFWKVTGVPLPALSATASNAKKCSPSASSSASILMNSWKIRCLLTPMKKATALLPTSLPFSVLCWQASSFRTQ